MRISDWSSDVCSSDLRADAEFEILEDADLDLVRAVGGLAGEREANAVMGDRGDRERGHSGLLAAGASLEKLDAIPIRSRLICESARSGKRSEEHTSELQSLMRTSYAVFCLTKKTCKSFENRATRTN